MDEAPKNIKVQPLPIEGIDFNKLRIVGSANWIWFLGIFIAVNFIAYLVVRYTKNLYESTSVIKLDVKKEASEFGIKSPMENQNLNLISGEIEIHLLPGALRIETTNQNPRILNPPGRCKNATPWRRNQTAIAYECYTNTAEPQRW